MRRIRLIPVLLLNNGRLVKSTTFKNYRYVGDPINAVKIFNEKEVDELVLLDITATQEKREPDIELLEKICTEAFMPVAYGGGISNIKQVKTILSTGVEKVAFNRAVFEDPELIHKASISFGSQSIVASIDIKKNLLGRYQCYHRNGSRSSGLDPVSVMEKMAAIGAGEIIVNSIDRDGTMRGIDMNLVQLVSNAVDIPVIVCGGLRSLDDASAAVNLGATGVAGGSFFVYKGPHKAVLISYPTQDELVAKMVKIL